MTFPLSGHLPQVFHYFVNLLAGHSTANEGVSICCVIVGAGDAVKEFFVGQALHKSGFEVGGAKIFPGVGRRAVSSMTTRALRLVNSFGLSEAVRLEE